jgi:hypothetical protein
MIIVKPFDSALTPCLEASLPCNFGADDCDRETHFGYLNDFLTAGTTGIYGSVPLRLSGEDLYT